METLLQGARGESTRTTGCTWRSDCWSSASGNPVVWTVDGMGLEYLMHFDGVKSGSKIFNGIPDDVGQPFSADMRASEVADLFVESFALALGAKVVRLLQLRPADFGAWPGFTFELDFESAEDLAMRAVATGAIVDGRLYLFVYAGARDYYFDKYFPQVEEIFGSITPVST